MESALEDFLAMRPEWATSRCIQLIRDDPGKVVVMWVFLTTDDGIDYIQLEPSEHSFGLAGAIRRAFKMSDDDVCLRLGLPRKKTLEFIRFATDRAKMNRVVGHLRNEQKTMQVAIKGGLYRG